MRKFLIVFIAFLFGVMTGTCTLDIAKGDDFEAHIAALKAKNAAKKPPAKAACACTSPADCTCGERCPCANCEGKNTEPVKPTRVRPAGDGWQWEASEGGYWWKWKNAPSLGVDPFAAANCANGQCGSQWTAANGTTYWTSAPAVSEWSNGSGRRGVFRGGFRSGGGGCGAGG